MRKQIVDQGGYIIDADLIVVVAVGGFATEGVRVGLLTSQQCGNQRRHIADTDKSIAVHIASNGDARDVELTAVSEEKAVAIIVITHHATNVHGNGHAPRETVG